jgi:hypothetical protein
MRGPTRQMCEPSARPPGTAPSLSWPPGAGGHGKPIGTLPAPVVASGTLLEVVVHGWDISQASGEATEIPDVLAVPVLEFARQPVVDANRGDNFAADLGIGDTPSDQLIAFLGRKPR